MSKLRVSVFSLWCCTLVGCGIEGFRLGENDGSAPPPANVVINGVFDHGPWGEVLTAHVDAAGWVDYAALKADHATLDRYIAALAVVDVDALRNDAERMAYWVNAYNAITVAGLVRFYPTKSIRDHSGFWDRVLTNCGGKDVSLNDIEHKTLRLMGDPRIHVAINCASVSCPALLNVPYTGAKLDAQLDEQSRKFLADPTRNRVTDSTEQAQISKIFDWFGEDFAVEPYVGVRGFVRAFAPTGVSLVESFDYGYLDYDWSLNGLRTASSPR